MRRPSIKTMSGDIDLAPLIDVVFLLLMFFMLTSTFRRQESIPVELPQAVTGEHQPHSVAVIVDRDGVVHVDGREVSLGVLGQRVKHAIESGPADVVSVHADSRMPVQRLVQVMDELQKSGIANVALATEETGN